ncbi:MAG: hypothetical protein ACKVHU_19130 [Acidimicrobiales bacterium]
MPTNSEADSQAAASEDLHDATERWFVRRGIPHFIHEYNASEDVFTRALPVLSLVFLAEIVVAADTEWGVGQNVLAVLFGIALLAGGYGAVNRMRDRPAFRPPDDVGLVELVAFVLLPALLPLIIGWRVKGFFLTVGFNLIVLAVLYGVILYGLVPMARWAIAESVQQLGGLARLMARSLPLVLVFSMFIFLNAELWQVADDFTGTYFWVSVGVLASVGSLFVLLRLPKEVQALREFDSWQDVCEVLADSPLEPEHADGLTGKPDPPPLTRQDWFNVGLVWVFSQAVQILLVGLAVGVFYVVFGVFTVRSSTIEQWTESDISVLWQINERLIISLELLKVAGFIAAFSSLQFAVSAVTDDTYRDEFLGELVDDVRESFAVRALYLARIGVSRSTHPKG